MSDYVKLRVSTTTMPGEVAITGYIRLGSYSLHLPETHAAIGETVEVKIPEGGGEWILEEMEEEMEGAPDA